MSDPTSPITDPAPVAQPAIPPVIHNILCSNCSRTLAIELLPGTIISRTDAIRAPENIAIIFRTILQNGWLPTLNTPRYSGARIYEMFFTCPNCQMHKPK